MNAADYALLIAKQSNAELIAIHVVRTEDAYKYTTDMFIDIEDMHTVTTADSMMQKVKDDTQKWFDTIKQKSSANGIRLRTGLVISPIKKTQDTIVDYAERENADLIVIGGGKSGLKERMLGSTSSHVATKSNRPVLIVK